MYDRMVLPFFRRQIQSTPDVEIKKSLQLAYDNLSPLFEKKKFGFGFGKIKKWFVGLQKNSINSAILFFIIDLPLYLYHNHSIILYELRNSH